MLTTPGMLKSYVRTALQHLSKNWIYSGINIVGLMVSLTSCVLIALYVSHELSYDTFFPDADRIYKLVVKRTYPSHSTDYAMVPHSWAKIIKHDFPEVEQTTRLFDPFLFGPTRRIIVTTKTGDDEVKTFEENNFLQADSTFLDFFSVQMVRGEGNGALARPDQILLSETAAKKYFGQEDPVGKEVDGDAGKFTVAGVFKDIPENSHMKIDLLGSLGGYRFKQRIDSEDFTWFMSHTYVKLKPGADVKALEGKFPKMVDRYAAAQIEHELGQSWERYKSIGNRYSYRLQPLTSIHTDPAHLEFPLTSGESLVLMKALILIAILLVGIACINFINLATARSLERAKEVGMRKVMGARRGQLMLQFMTEAVLISVIAMVLSTAAVNLLLPLFNTLVERQLHLALNAPMIFGLTGLAFLTGVLSGFYPAIALSNFKPVTAMKGNHLKGSGGSWLRNGLVLFQFAVAIVLIVGTLVVTQQTNFIEGKNLGFEKEQVLMLKRARELGPQREAFVSELMKINGVQLAAATSTMVGNRDDVYWQKFKVEGSSEILTSLSMEVDDNFPEVVKFNLAEGRMFTRQTNDSLNLLLNEAAVKTMGLVNPIGKKLSQMNIDAAGNTSTVDFTIVGVIKDFHFQSLRDKISPLVIFSNEHFGQQSASSYIAVQVNKNLLGPTISSIEALWKRFVPNRPFTYEFLDQFLNQLYTREQLSRKLLAIFSALAIIIACVGVFGLSAYSATLRTKEIGIRKVLGSSVAQIFVLLSKAFAKLLVPAFVVACPVSWILMDSWLNDFAYRIDLGVTPFIVAGLLSVVIALLTVSYHSIKAALRNPVESLRSE